MAEKKFVTKTVRIEGRLSFPHLFEAQKGKYNASILFAKNSTAYKTIYDAILEVAKEKWDEQGAKLAAIYIQKDQTCLHDGAEKAAKYDGYEGMWYVSASNKKRPLLLDADKTPLVAEDGRPYGGCYVNAVLDIYPMDAFTGNDGEAVKAGIHAKLAGVQFVRDGDSFGGGRVASADDFDDVANTGAQLPPQGGSAHADLAG